MLLPTGMRFDPSLVTNLKLNKMSDLEKQRAREINSMSMQEIVSMTYRLTPEQLDKWAGSGYSGKTYVELVGI